MEAIVPMMFFGAICVVLSFFIIQMISTFWVYSDANSWGQPGWLWALAVFFLSWPLCFVIYLIFRHYERPKFRRKNDFLAYDRFGEVQSQYYR